MSNVDVIRQYLVELGAEVDTQSLKKVNQELDKLDKVVSKSSKKIDSFFAKLKSYFKVLAKSFSSYTALASAAYKFASSIASADMEMQKFARRIFTTDENAKGLRRTLDAMGLSGIEELQDVALNPELASQYLELRRLANTLANTEDIRKSMQEIRAISFEFRKLKLTASYFIDYVVSWIYKLSSGPASKFRKWLQDFNNKFSKNIEAWAKRVASWVSVIFRSLDRMQQILSNTWNALSPALDKILEVFKQLPGIVQLLAGMGAVILAAWSTSGLTRWLIVLQGILLLLDDFMTYREGGISAFPGMWSYFDKVPTEGNLWDTLLGGNGIFWSWSEFIADKVIKPLVDGFKEALDDSVNNIKEWLQTTFPRIFGKSETQKEIDILENLRSMEPERYYDPTLYDEEGYYNPYENAYSNIDNRQNITINVNGSDDPQEVANNVVSLIRNRSSGSYV